MGQLSPNCGANMALVKCIYHMNVLPPTFLKYKLTCLVGKGNLNIQNFGHW
jgi:hypothetical protein